DTLWKISLRFKVSLDKLIKLNKIKNPDLIYPDHILKIS
ncbi:MAG: LysM peptidoglycan-binding domain-containing protein, partial [Firmicutes bacterium]|nr:LysM peptidoglycan-binding domain-containing protein [Bacillota bacterium]